MKEYHRDQLRPSPEGRVGMAAISLALTEYHLKPTGWRKQRSKSALMATKEWKKSGLKGWPYAEFEDAKFRSGEELYNWPRSMRDSEGQLLYVCFDVWLPVALALLTIAAEKQDRNLPPTLKSEELQAVDEVRRQDRRAISIRKAISVFQHRLDPHNGVVRRIKDLRSLGRAIPAFSPLAEKLATSWARKRRELEGKLYEIDQEADWYEPHVTDDALLQQLTMAEIVLDEFWVSRETVKVQTIEKQHFPCLPQGKVIRRHQVVRWNNKNRFEAKPDLFPRWCPRCAGSGHPSPNSDSHAGCPVWEKQERLLANGFVELLCIYPLCEKPWTHRTPVCPTMIGRCDSCHYRGHENDQCPGDNWQAREAYRVIFHRFDQRHAVLKRAVTGLNVARRRQESERVKQPHIRLDLAWSFYPVPINVRPKEWDESYVDHARLPDVERQIHEWTEGKPIFDLDEFEAKYGVRRPETLEQFQGEPRSVQEVLDREAERRQAELLKRGAADEPRAGPSGLQAASSDEGPAAKKSKDAEDSEMKEDASKEDEEERFDRLRNERD
jgi:hypothetical protein